MTPLAAVRCMETLLSPAAPTTLATSPPPGPIVAVEHLSPHDLVTYYRCPHEMELHRAQHLSWRTGQLMVPLTPSGTTPGAHSPLPPPPGETSQAQPGRLIVGPHDRLLYQDPDESGLPILFPPEQSHAHSFVRQHGSTLMDRDWGLSGRPDLVVRRGDGQLFPVEYKETHLWEGYMEHHGRFFDILQVIAECRLVETTWGSAPRFGVVYYGDSAGGGEREGYVEVPYGDAQRNWLQRSLAQIRADRIRAPVPADRNCQHCEPNRDGLCRYACGGFDQHRPNERDEPFHRRRFY